MIDEFRHISVMLNESINALSIKDNGIYVDATCGGAGHSKEILKKLKTGHLYSFDQDIYAIKKSNEILSKVGKNYTLINDNFKNIKKRLNELGIEKIDGIIYDLGVSSFQLDIPNRGFSYRYNSRIDMRMDRSKELDAYYIVNNFSFNDLFKIISYYGDEKYAKNIASNIVKEREKKYIETTFELVDIIKRSVPYSYLNTKGHPAKKTFQALRVYVNDEINVFKDSLEDVLSMMNKDARCVVLTFQPLEDKECMRIFKKYTKDKIPSKVPIVGLEEKEFEIINKNVKVSNDEINDNNRSHSVKFRVIKKI